MIIFEEIEDNKITKEKLSDRIFKEHFQENLERKELR